jgi:uncharacterized repeat protein (TIGR01451 family)
MKKNLLLSLLIFPYFLSFSQFSNQTETVTSNFGEVTSIVYGDLDGDGWSDIIFGFASSGIISWSKNLGGIGDWATHQMIDDQQPEVAEIHTVDIDQDGDTDILIVTTSSYNDNRVIWYENDGSGNMTTHLIDFQVDDNISGREISVHHGDMDSDGDIDIVVAYEFVDKIVWYRNEDGLGNFSEEIEISADIYEPRKIELADIDGDTYLDIVVLTGNDKVYGFKNFNGLGVFGNPNILINAGQETGPIDIGDLDEDGDLDIVIGVIASDKIYWYENMDNTGIFSDAKILSNDVDRPEALELVDIDNDNDLDLVYYAFFGGEIGLFRNAGNGVFDDKEIIVDDLQNTYNGYVSTFDFDSDGDLDVLMTGGYDVKQFVFFNADGQGNFQGQDYLNMASSYIDDFYAEDVNQDGDMDFLFHSGIYNSSSSNPFKISSLLYNETYNQYERPEIINDSLLIGEMLIQDVDFDGVNDLTYSVFDSDTIAIQFNDGTGGFSNPTVIQASGAVRTILQADLNNDGFADLIAAGNWGVDAFLEWFPRDGATPNYLAPQNINSGQTFEDIVAIDFDNDSDIDLVTTTRTFGTGEINWWENDNGNFTGHLISDQTEAQEILVYDFDDDGLLDVVGASSYDSRIYFIKNEGLGNFGSVENISNYLDYPTNLHLFDFDMDGDMDLLFNNNQTPGLFWLEKGVGTDLFGIVQPISLGFPNIEKFDLVDMDFDGDMDLVFLGGGILRWKKGVANDSKLAIEAFFDKNNNGIFDNGELLMNGFQYTIDPDPLLLFTNPSGRLEFFLEEGSYTVNALPRINWDVTTSNTQNTFIPEMSADTLRFGYFPNNEFSDLQPDLTSAATRCGFDVPFWLSYNNFGTMIENGWIELQTSDLVTFLDATPVADSISGNSYFWEIENSIPTQGNGIKLNFQIESADFLGDTIFMTANTYNLNEEVLNSYHFESIINCAYDPNDKMVNPPGVLDENYVLFDEQLNYTIRFQNTGTDTAFNVLVTDILDPNLDWNTFQLVATSHSVAVTFEESIGQLNFRFENILLPDSIVNEPASHGFIKYKIRPLGGLPENTLVQNFADIFFDFNEAIRTNTTSTTYVSVIPIIDGVRDLENIAYHVFPNPFDEGFILKSTGTISPHETAIVLTDILGRKIKAKIVFGENQIRVEPQSDYRGIIICTIHDSESSNSNSMLLLKK